MQLKKNQGVLLFWLLLFAYVTQNLAVKYGIPHLFLYPEYLGSVNFFSHLVLGFSCGVFIMAYNISTYIINAYKFPFIATLNRPFLKFCYNNGFIPAAFVVVYIYNMILYQYNVELESINNLVFNILGFISGNFVFIGLSTLYFVSTNKNVFSYRRKKADDNLGVRDILHRKNIWDKMLNRESRWKIETYLAQPYKIALARSSEHYDRETLYKVFNQNHLNASIFEIMSILSILLIGIFREVEWINIPASASVFLLFAIILMISSAIYSWLKGWSFALFLAAFLILNHAYQEEIIGSSNAAYGLNYNGNQANYHEEFLVELARDKYVEQKDHDAGIEVLERWKRNQIKLKGDKPKLLIINTSGGGLRSMMWTTLSMMHINEALNGDLLSQTHLITGSSGGMIGASFVRELYLRKQLPEQFDDEMDDYANMISRDMLNPVIMNLVTGDIFFKYLKFRDGDYTYYKDRGYAFERTLNENLRGVFDRRLGDYQELEANADIPIMLFSPTIINDGRRLIVSSLPMSYMVDNLPRGSMTNEPILENIEFSKFFQEQDAMNIRFSSVLRMSATFPYILPPVTLPSDPEIKVMDAGIRDNYGLTTSLKYLYEFREWISENTSGVIILQLRDKFKSYQAKSRTKRSLIGNITSPLNNFYSNWTNVQNFEQDQLLQYTSTWFDGEIEIIPFQLKNEVDDRISLSWHLTNGEKMRIKKSINLKENKAALQRLQALLSANN